MVQQPLSFAQKRPSSSMPSSGLRMNDRVQEPAVSSIAVITMRSSFSRGSPQGLVSTLIVPDSA